MATKLPGTRSPEDLAAPAEAENVIDYIRNWGAKEKLAAIIQKTPKDNLIDYHLVTMDALDTWVSRDRRMIIIGDAAHPYLPTSGQAGGQAIEDGATVAILLEQAGRKAVPLAICATECLR